MPSFCFNIRVYDRQSAILSAIFQILIPSKPIAVPQTNRQALSNPPNYKNPPNCNSLSTDSLLSLSKSLFKKKISERARFEPTTFWSARDDANHYTRRTGWILMIKYLSDSLFHYMSCKWHACVRACVRACIHARLSACMCACMPVCNQAFVCDCWGGEMSADWLSTVKSRTRQKFQFSHGRERFWFFQPLTPLVAWCCSH